MHKRRTKMNAESLTAKTPGHIATCPNRVTTRRGKLGRTTAALTVAAFVTSIGAGAAPLVLEEHGQFVVGGQLVHPTIISTTRDPPNPPPLEERDILVGQMYVEYFIPASKKNRHLPVVMTHSARSGINWLTTPDGREGWAHFFV